MNNSENITNLQSEKQAFEKEISYWNREIFNSRNMVYIAKCLKTVKRYENSILQIEGKINELTSPISSPYSIDGI